MPKRARVAAVVAARGLDVVQRSENDILGATVRLADAVRALNKSIHDLIDGGLGGRLITRNIDLGDVDVSGPYTLNPILPEAPTNTNWITPGLWLDCSRAFRGTLYIHSHTITDGVFIQLVGSPSAPDTGSPITQYDIDELLAVKVKDSVAVTLPFDEAWHPFFGVRVAAPSGTTGKIKVAAFIQEWE